VKHIPDWFPGAGFKQFAKVGRGLFDVAVDGPLDYVKESLKVRPSHAYLDLVDRTIGRPMEATSLSLRRVSTALRNFQIKDLMRL